MTHYLKLIPISAKIHRRQSRMTRICITLAVLLTAVIFGLADMYLQGVIHKQMEEKGDWHYQFDSIDMQTAAAISARPEVRRSGWHGTISADAGYTIDDQPLAVSAQKKQVFEDIFMNRITEGEYPEADNEIAVSSFLKDRASLSLHETIEITRPDNSTADCLVVGFLDDSETARLGIGTPPAAVMTPEGLAALSPSAHAYTAKSYMVQFSTFCRIPTAIADIKAQNQISDEQVTGNLALLSIEGQLEGSSGINQIYKIAVVLSVIVMLTCVLMISSSLNSNVAQRTEFFGMLRCLGATKKQIMRFVRCEGLYWCKTAIPAGIGLSILIVWMLSAAMGAVSPQWFSGMPRFGISWISIAASTILGLLTVLLAARSPAKRAAGVSPRTAQAGNTGSTVLFCKAANTRFLKIETALGIHHAKAGKRNYLLMTGAFAVCIALFLTFSTLADFMKNAFMPPAWTPELSIASETNTCSIGSGLLEQVRQNPAVKRAYGRMFAYDVPAQSSGRNYNSNVISYEENQFQWAAEALLSGSMERVMQQDNQVLFVQTENTDMKVGDRITLTVNDAEHAVTVAGILSDSPLARAEGAETIFCSERTFTELTGQTGYTIIDVQFHNNADSKDVQAIEGLFSDGGTVFLDKLAAVQQQRNLYRAFSILVYGFLSIIAAITVFHIMNTINMGAAAKMKEYGAMRAIGMSTRQLIKMIAAEAGTYAVSGVLLGCIIGIPLHWLIYVSLITNFWGSEWKMPLIPLGLIICTVFAASLLSVQGPAKRLYQMSVVENISVQ